MHAFVTEMSLLKYFRPVKDKAEDKQLPSPTVSLSKLIPSSAIVSINSSVKEEMKKTRSKRAPYLIKTPAQRFQVGKRAAKHGVTATIRYYTRKFPDLDLKETTVRRLKDKYKASLKTATRAPADVD